MKVRPTWRMEQRLGLKAFWDKCCSFPSDVVLLFAFNIQFCSTTNIFITKHRRKGILVEVGTLYYTNNHSKCIHYIITTLYMYKFNSIKLLKSVTFHLNITSRAFV